MNATRESVRTVYATHVVRRERTGSSSPVVVESVEGLWFTKLRGAAQGVPPLIAELIVGELADRVMLAVPSRALVEVPVAISSADVSDELRDLLNASAGCNVGFELLEAARNLTRAEYERVPLDIAASVLWLDMLVQNLDRSPANPNIMVRRGTYWLIDHGAALPFQHDWSAVREDSAQRPYDIAAHVFGWAAPVLSSAHETLAWRLTRDAIHDAIAVVPDEFLSVFGGETERRRAMYAALLWKRLQYMHDTLGAR
ncbi:MAG: HipA family kinase [Gemmatimonas sp.]